MQKILQTDIDILETEGYCLIKNFISKDEIAPLQKLLESKQNCRFCLNKIPELKPYAKIINDDLSCYAKNLAFNRSIFFNKTPLKNWSVLWHQDLTICVKEKIDTKGYGPWSTKENIPHVQAPQNILKSMITARLHIDDTSANNGALKVIPQSHKKILSREELEKLTANYKTISAKQGDLLLMKPLLLHSSDSSSKNSSSRRILHLEFLTQNLNNDLKLYHPQYFL